MRRLFIMAVAMPMALLALLPSVEAQELGPPPEAGGSGGASAEGFHGFQGFDTHAQAQVVTLTGYLNAFREDNSLVGALTEINGPPVNSRNITALVQRGRGATFVYGVLGGEGGGRGTLPDPPPGEANAFYPSGPFEKTWTGPITGLGVPQVVDSRFRAVATETPTGRTEGAITALNNPGYFTVGQATVVAHSEPADGGVVAESVSVVHQFEAGPVLIQNIVSRAYAFVPVSGEPKGIATTVVEGATVAGTPVQITDQGVVVADNKNPLQQEQVNKALADAGFEQVRLLPSFAQPNEDGSSVNTAAGTLEFVKKDEGFGASNPQGFSGGGFSVGGADAFVNTRRCSPDCGGTGSDDSGSDVSSGDSTGGDLPGGATSAESQAPDSTLSSDDLGEYSADAATLTTDAGGVGFDSSFTLSSGGGGIGLSGGSGPGGVSSTTAVTPPGDSGGGGIDSAAGVDNGGVPLQQQAALAFTEFGPKTTDWVRDFYLMAALALGVIFVGQRLARAF